MAKSKEMFDEKGKWAWLNKEPFAFITFFVVMTLMFGSVMVLGLVPCLMIMTGVANLVGSPIHWTIPDVLYPITGIVMLIGIVWVVIMSKGD